MQSSSVVPSKVMIFDPTQKMWKQLTDPSNPSHSGKVTELRNVGFGAFGRNSHPEPVHQVNFLLNERGSFLDLRDSTEVSIRGFEPQAVVNLTNCETVFVDLPWTARIRIIGNCKNINITIKDIPSSRYPHSYQDCVEIEDRLLCDNIVIYGHKLGEK